MLTDVQYVGSAEADQGYAATICTKHNTREIAAYVFQLEELECGACIREEDGERAAYEARAEMLARQGHPSICLCNTCAPWEAEYDQQDADEAARLHVASIDSPNYCGHQESQFGDCWSEDCRRKCKDIEPPF